MVRAGWADRARTRLTSLEMAIIALSVAAVTAMVAPRLSSAEIVPGGGVESLASLQAAVDAYARDHGGRYPSAALLERQLTDTTDRLGVPGRGSLGPYLQRVPAASAAWNYDEATGRVRVKTER